MEHKKMRSHISVVIENAGRLLGVLLAIAVSQIDDIIKNLNRLNEAEGKFYFIGLAIFIIAVVFVLLFYLNRWYKTTILLEDGMLVIEQNTLNRKKNTYAIKNISNIDMEQNLFERIIGTYKIKIDTNSSALANKTDIKIVFSKEKALELKKEVMTYISQPDSVILSEEEEIPFDVVYSKKDIALNCFYTASIFSVFFILLIVGTFLVLTITGVLKGKEDKIGEIFGGLVAILIGIISSIYSIVKVFMKFYDFRVRRDSEKIYIKHGMIKKCSNTIPINKINGVKLIQPFFSRIFRRYQVEIINIGTGNEENESSYLLLSCSKKDIKKYMGILLPEFEAFIDMPVEKQSRKYFVHTGLYLMIEALLLVLVVYGINYFWEEFAYIIGKTAAIVILLLSVFAYVCAYFAEGYYIGETYMIVTKGIFTKTSTMIFYDKIQHIAINEGVISKITKLKKATIFIWASLLQSSMSLPLAKKEVLEKIAKGMIDA